jgi:cell division protein FtsL
MFENMEDSQKSIKLIGKIEAVLLLSIRMTLLKVILNIFY